MLFNSLKTGRTDLRDTLVQQPKTTETSCCVMSSRAFSANSGQLEAGSTTTASSFLPSRPPFSFCSSMSISMTSLRVVSLMAIVPESECKTPTLMVSSACDGRLVAKASAAKLTALLSRPPKKCSRMKALSLIVGYQLTWQGACHCRLEGPAGVLTVGNHDRNIEGR